MGSDGAVQGEAAGDVSVTFQGNWEASLYLRDSRRLLRPNQSGVEKMHTEGPAPMAVRYFSSISVAVHPS